MKKMSILALALGYFSSVSVAQVEEDDFLLFIVPSIIAGANTECDSSHKSKCDSNATCDIAGGYWYSNRCNTEPLSLVNIRKLAGDWYFTTTRPNGEYPHDNNFRFDPSTIERLDAVSHYIDGDRYGPSFLYPSQENVGGIYDTEASSYIVADVWGPPTDNLSTIYIFKSADKNTETDCMYFADASGIIKSTYEGFGGTTPCHPLTKVRRETPAAATALLKSRRSNDQDEQSQLIKDELKRISELEQSASQSGTLSPQAIRIQELVNLALDK